MRSYTSSKGSHFRVGSTKILYLIGDANYCRIYLITGEIVMMSRTLKWYEGRWPSFIRIHKHTLINPTYARSLQLAPRYRENSYVVMDDYASLRIARRRRAFIESELAHLHVEAMA